MAYRENGDTANAQAALAASEALRKPRIGSASNNSKACRGRPVMLKPHK
jgi:hypothetical protein